MKDAKNPTKNYNMVNLSDLNMDITKSDSNHVAYPSPPKLKLWEGNFGGLVKDIPENEFDEAFAIIFQLRPHLTLEQFKLQIVEQKKAGYLLIGAYSPELQGLMGMRPLQTLARGKHLHIDDLVVDKKYKKSGAGSALIEFAQKGLI
ncbi:MAG: GNAT family N-acetyltransferase [Thermodesulfobacteriota bacterium]|nr:GNAT family N-acetyltransferase [Thermodesulfobacteriota bacterium]